MTKASTREQRGKTAEQRFAEKVTKLPCGCHRWTSAIGSRGYGIFWVSPLRRSVGAHRFALEMKIGGPIPDGMLVMHSCDNEWCVNPEHLRAGTNSENLLDASRKGRIARGERNGGGGKLSESAARQILNTKGVTGPSEAARRFGVSTQTVKAIRRGRIWRHLGAPA